LRQNHGIGNLSKDIAGQHLDPAERNLNAVLDTRMRFRATALLVVLASGPAGCAHADYTGLCRPFSAALDSTPHSMLQVSSGEFPAIRDRETYVGCQVQYETNDSLLAGVHVPEFNAYEGSPMYQAGWRQIVNMTADGPGSGIFAIEKGPVSCVLSWERPAEVDEGGDVSVSTTLTMTIQCRES